MIQIKRLCYSIWETMLQFTVHVCWETVLQSMLEWLRYDLQQVGSLSLLKGKERSHFL
jgi:hypothetical protein